MRDAHGHLIPTTKEESADINADLILRNVVSLHGLPRSIINDREPRMTNQFWQFLCAKLDIRHIAITAYHPQTNGFAERSIQNMKNVLRVSHLQSQSWYDVLPLAEIAMNNAPIRNTAYTTFFLNYGYHHCFTADVFNLHSPAHDASEDATDFISSLHLQCKTAHAAIVEAVARYADQVNPHHRETDISVGDQVLVNIAKHDAKSFFPRVPLMPLLWPFPRTQADCH